MQRTEPSPNPANTDTAPDELALVVALADGKHPMLNFARLVAVHLHDEWQGARRRTGFKNCWIGFSTRQLADSTYLSKETCGRALVAARDAGWIELRSQVLESGVEVRQFWFTPKLIEALSDLCERAPKPRRVPIDVASQWRADGVLTSYVLALSAAGFNISEMTILLKRSKRAIARVCKNCATAGQGHVYGDALRLAEIDREALAKRRGVVGVHEARMVRYQLESDRHFIERALERSVQEMLAEDEADHAKSAPRGGFSRRSRDLEKKGSSSDLENGGPDCVRPPLAGEKAGPDMSDVVQAAGEDDEHYRTRYARVFSNRSAQHEWALQRA
jgi:hypothetical protein